MVFPKFPTLGGLDGLHPPPTGKYLAGLISAELKTNQKHNTDSAGMIMKPTTVAHEPKTMTPDDIVQVIMNPTPHLNAVKTSITMKLEDLAKKAMDFHIAPEDSELVQTALQAIEDLMKIASPVEQANVLYHLLQLDIVNFDNTIKHIEEMGAMINKKDFKTVIELSENLSKLKAKDAAAIEEMVEEILDHLDVKLTPDYEKLYSQASSDVELLQLELEELKEKHETVQRQLENNQYRYQEHTAPKYEIPETMWSLLSGNATVLNVIELVQELWPNVVILDSALKSAQQSPYSKPDKLLTSLRALIGPYYDAIISGIPDGKARDLLGAVYKANESEATMTNQKLMRRRQFIYNGQPYVFEQHLTIGVRRNPATTIQVYFRIIDKVMVIGYVGEHLDVPTT